MAQGGSKSQMILSAVLVNYGPKRCIKNWGIERVQHIIATKEQVSYLFVESFWLHGEGRPYFATGTFGLASPSGIAE